MENNNWRANPPGAEPVSDPNDWRSQLQPDSRGRIVNKIMETLKRHLPFSGQEGLNELRKIAVRFEEKIYTAATSQSDYLRKISLKMLTMETKSQTNIGNSLPANSAGNSSNPPDRGSLGMPSQVLGHGQSIPIPLSANQQPQPRQQILSQNIPNNISSAAVQSSTGLPSLTQSSNLTQTSLPNIGQNANMQSLSGVSQNSAGNSMGQGTPANVFANSQRQMQGRQQVIPQQGQQVVPQQGQHTAQNAQQYIYQQMVKQKLQQQGNVSQSMIQSHMQQQQQQQQNILQTNHLQQTTPSMLQHQQSILRQPQQQQQSSTGIQQQQPPMTQQQQQQQQQPQLIGQQLNASNMQQNQLIGQQSNVGNMQQNQLIGQQNNVGNMQQNQLIGQQNNVGTMQQTQQQQQRMLNQQSNNLPNLQQQQQLMAHQNNLSNLHQQQLDPQSNITGLQHQQQQQNQQLLGTQSGNSTMQNNQHSMHMLQQPKVPLQQQGQQTSSNLLPTQGQQLQPQSQQQQMMSQMQSQQPAQMPQQMGMQQQQQSNALQRDMQQRLQAPGQQPSGSLLQQQNMIDQQKQMYQSQRPLPETSSTSQDSTAQTGQSNGGDWQEEVYQKIKTMKDNYFPELNEMYQKIATKLQQHESHPQQPRSDQLEKLKIFKSMLERIISFLQVPKENVQPAFKEKLSSYEKQIINFINTNRPRPRKPDPPSLQQGQLPPSQMHSMQQPQSQIHQVQSHENQMNPQMQTMNLQGPVGVAMQNSMNNLQQNSMSSMSGVTSAPQNIINSPQQGSNLESGQGTQLHSLAQVGVGSVQQNPTTQQANINSLVSQSGVNMLQPNINQHSNANMLQHQHLKQQEQQMMQTQQRQLQQRQMQQQILQQQSPQQMQQLHQQAKPQLSAQLQAPHQMNDVNDMKMRQGFGIKPGAFQQHLGVSQRSTYPHQQLKPGASFSAQMPQAASPQFHQHSSPLVDQQNLLSTLTKTGTPLSANSPFIVPSPSTPLAPSPMPGEFEKPSTSISSLSNAGNITHQQTTGAQATASSLAIGTPGISASPLLAEFTSPDGTHANVLPTTGKSAGTENPIERLMRAVKSASPKALDAAVNDIGSVVSMMDRIAGSAPGNGSRAAVGEDLVAMTKCRLQARNFITQDGVNGTKKMRRYTSAMPLNAVSPAGSMNEDYRQLAGSETSDVESTANSCIKRRRIEVNHTLFKEINEINRRLVDTEVAVSDEDDNPATTAEGGEGTIVKFSFVAVALCPKLKYLYNSAQMSQIQPLRLLVPADYPSSSPTLMDKLPVEVSKEHEDLSAKAKSMFSRSLRNLSQPMSLGDIAKTWDGCARAVISEYAQQSGGGTFSSKYGTWGDCSIAS